MLRGAGGVVGGTSDASCPGVTDLRCEKWNEGESRL